VAYLDGSTLYVTNAEGNTVKVTTSAGTTVNKTVKSDVKSIHPGETVTITGETGSGATISAESINVGSGGGGLAALFGGSGGRGGSGSGGSKGGEPALFGG
jgi:flagellar hook assembly protein FlgD